MFKTLAYAKVNVDFDKDQFIKEYDKYIVPAMWPIANGKPSIDHTVHINEQWKMVDPNIYETSDYHIQSPEGGQKYVTRERRMWRKVDLLQLDTTNITDPKLLAGAFIGGVSLRNETLDKNFVVKNRFKDLEITKWIYSLPFSKINAIFCVSIEPGGFATIHRDQRGYFNDKSSAGMSKVFNNGFIILNINITSGDAPLYWALDGKDLYDYKKVNDPVYITNDYFLHGVPVVTSRRRQIRVTGIPKPEMWDLIDKENMVDVGDSYNYFPYYTKE